MYLDEMDKENIKIRITIIAVVLAVSAVITAGVVYNCRNSDNTLKTEYETVEAKVTETHHTAGYSTATYNAMTKTAVPVYHPATYEVDLEYDGCVFTINGDEDSYNKCKDKESELVKVKLKLIYYKDGTIKRSIASVL